MESRFSLDLHGRDWWKPFLIFWLVFVAAYVPLLMLQRWMPQPVHYLGRYLLVVFAFTVVMLVDQTIFSIVAFRIVLPRLSVGGKSFAFRGSIGRFLGINLLGALLSIVTLTVYMPWYVRRIMAYLASESSFDGETPEFLGKGGRLFVYLLLGMWLPVIVLSVGLGLLVGLSGTAGTGGGVSLLTTLITVLIFLVLVPFLYLTYRWYINFRWRDVVVRWVTRFWPAVGFLLGQILLTIVTVGIYWPAAVLRMVRYFCARTAFFRGEEERGRLAFEASISRGFGLIWGQTLLSIITAGIYLPWAVARVGRWCTESLTYRPSSSEATAP